MPDEEVQGAQVVTDDMPALTPAPAGSLEAADAKWNEVMGDDGESFADLLGVEKTDNTTLEPAEPAGEVALESEPEVKSPAADSGTPSIDASLVSLAVELGADKAEVDNLIKSDPARATELLTQLQEEYNSQTLGLLGGTALTGVQPHVQESSASDDNDDVSKSPLGALLTDPDAKQAAVDQYGENFVDKILVPLAKRDAEISKREAKIDQLFDDMEAARQQARIATIETTFQGFGPGYADFYGAGAETLSEVQTANRRQVGQIADRLRVGDRVHGAPDQGDAHYLTRAHHIVAAEQRKAAARKEIIAQLKTRSGGLLARPSRGQVDRIQPGEKSSEAAQQAIDRKITQLGLDAFFED